MKKFKGTKGQWKIAGYTGQHNEAGAAIKCNEEFICTTASLRCGNWVEYQANAKLIAAAPELLEVLQELLGEIEDTGMFLKAESVISKALD